MFAVRANEPVKIDRAFEGLARLSHEHKDGWGVVHFDGGNPWTETSSRTARDCDRFDSFGRVTATTSLMAHIRLASVGAVHTDNSHPFIAGPLAFMHNGTLNDFENRRSLIEAEIAPSILASLKGQTDSERCFGLLLTYLGSPDRDLDRCAAALRRMVSFVSRTCDGPPAETPSALNFLVSDGRWLLATRRGRTLFVAERSGTRFIASESLWSDESWTPVPENSLVRIDEQLALQIEALETSAAHQVAA